MGEVFCLSNADYNTASNSSRMENLILTEYNRSYTVSA